MYKDFYKLKEKYLEPRDMRVFEYRKRTYKALLVDNKWNVYNKLEGESKPLSPTSRPSIYLHKTVLNKW